MFFFVSSDSLNHWSLHRNTFRSVLPEESKNRLKIASFSSRFGGSRSSGDKKSYINIFKKVVSIESVGNFYSQSFVGADRVKESAKVKGNSGFGDYSAAGEFEVWGEEKNTSDGLDHHQVRPPSRQQRCEGASSLRPLLHVAHCELHSPREAELLRLDHLETLDHKSIEHDTYSMMDNFHSPVPPPLPRRHVR